MWHAGGNAVLIKKKESLILHLDPDGFIDHINMRQTDKGLLFFFIVISLVVKKAWKKEVWNLYGMH